MQKNCLDRGVHLKSTHPAQGGTEYGSLSPPPARNFNPPTPHGVGPRLKGGLHCIDGFQSTHPARGGTRSNRCFRRNRYFNPPTPHGVGRGTGRCALHLHGNFNPPTPHGVGRRTGKSAERADRDFNPPTPHGVGPYRAAFALTLDTFQSTHPARGGTSSPSETAHTGRFQSTHPARGGTIPRC